MMIQINDRSDIHHLYKPHKSLILIAINLGVMFTMFIVWFVPNTHNIIEKFDSSVFLSLNGLLLCSHALQFIIALLNHSNESWINVVVMMFINLSMLFGRDNECCRLRLFKEIIYFWLFFQVVLLTNSFLFSKILDIHRLSPSVVILPIISLSETINISDIKELSCNSFPAGHTLIAVYWMCFSVFEIKHHILYTILVYVIGIFIIIPRLFTGAHWMTDVLFTIPLGLMWFYCAKYFLYKIYQFNQVN
ncbi:MAG: phosphatase PAP2 family protein [Rickettsiaceae bacterium]